MADNNLMDRILDDREKRYNEVLNLIDKTGNIVVCGKVNYPGVDKCNPYIQKAFEILKEALLASFKIDDYAVLKGYDGPAIIFSSNLKISDTKRTAVKIEEEHPLGRIFDIDVYRADGSPISRTELDFPYRKCIICGKNAKICVRQRAHDINEVIGKINSIIENY